VRGPLTNALSGKRDFGKGAPPLLSFNKHSLISKCVLVILLYNLAYRVTIYYTCKSCIVLEAYSQERHLQAQLYQLLGDELKATAKLLNSYNLRGVAELREYKPRPKDKCQITEYLVSYNSIYYL
jgi:hypothetical protein